MLMQEQLIPTHDIKTLVPGGAFSDIALLTLESFSRHAPTARQPCRYRCYVFLLVTEGMGTHAIDLQRLDLRPQRLFLILPGQVHTLLDASDVNGRVLLFNDTFITPSQGRSTDAVWPLLTTNQTRAFKLLTTDMEYWKASLAEIEREITSEQEYRREILFHIVSLLLIRAARSRGARNQKRSNVPYDFLFNFQELIEENFMTLKTPRDYAAKMNITPNYLNALCRKKSGKSAGELIRQRILLEAKRLLAHSTMSISEIAFQLGFEDNSYFGRYFRRYTRLTPGEFRQQQLPR
jgi:AraC-like DNA-binding protein